MVTFTMARKLGALVVLGGVSSVLIALVGWTQLAGSRDALHTQALTATALRNQVEMDMMHDALRAGAMGALVARSDEELGQVRADVDVHVERMKALLAKNQALPLSPKIVAVIAGIEEELVGYTDASVVFVESVVADPELAREQLPAFVEVFYSLETGLEEVSSALEGDVQGAERAAADRIANGQRALLIATVFAIVASAAASTRMARGFTRRLGASVAVLNKVANKDLRTTLEDDRADELGEMAAAVNRTVANTRDAVEQIRSSAQLMRDSLQRLGVASNQMSMDARITSDRARGASTTAMEVSANVAMVAASTQELGTSVGEVSHAASEAAAVASEAVVATKQTNEKVSRLGLSSASITSVINVITSIAEQTHLLALNATIEAARAGPAGKGFAVVASEVKELAQETAKATGEIRAKVEAIRADTTESVDAINQIGSIIGRINEIQAHIAVSVEEQAATTMEISRVVNDVAIGSSEMSEVVGSVAETAEGTAAAMSETLIATTDLSRLSTDLENLVGAFRLS